MVFDPTVVLPVQVTSRHESQICFQSLGGSEVPILDLVFGMKIAAHDLVEALSAEV